MIACVSPADYNLDESLSTLRYADRARQIKNKPIINTDPKMQEIQKLHGIIQQLRLDLLTKHAEINPPLHSDAPLMNTTFVAATRLADIDEIKSLRSQLEESHREYDGLLKKFELSISDIANLNMKLYTSETTIEDLLLKLNGLSDQITALNATLDPVETCPAEFVVQGRAVRQLKESVTTICSELQQSIRPMTRPTSAASNLSIDDNYHTANEEEAEAKAATYRNTQIGYQDQLRAIQEELEIKTQLHERLHQNVSGLDTYENESRVQDYVQQMATMEREIQELKSAKPLNKLVKTSAKLSEERRRKILELETKLAAVQKKSQRQALLLATREKDVKKVTLMEQEIATMKQKKVQLIKSMKTESEEFRKWKQTVGKEMLQLRAKDRKRDIELCRNQQLHERQRNVLKRKVDEALQSNKRLKDALDKHRLVQSQRRKAPSSSSSHKTDQIHTLIDNEIEMIYSVVDAKHATDQLIEDRAAMNMRLLALRKQNRKKALTGADKEVCDQLAADIDMRNAQISDMQEKIKSSNIDEKIRHIIDSLTGMPEAREAVKHLFTSLSDLRAEFDTNLSKLHDMRMATEANDERVLSLDDEWSRRFYALQSDHEKLKVRMVEVESSYELKVSMLLHTLNDAGKLTTIVEGEQGNNDMQDIYESTMCTLREKIEGYEAEIQNYKEQLALHTRYVRKAKVRCVFFCLYMIFSLNV